MALMDDIRLLSQVPLFAGLSEDQLRLIAFGAERRRVSTGQLLFRENSPAECAFLVIKGLFELSNMGRGGKPVLATRSGEGTLLSELALFTLCERKFTAVAAEDSEVIRIPAPSSTVWSKNILMWPTWLSHVFAITSHHWHLALRPCSTVLTDKTGQSANTMLKT